MQSVTEVRSEGRAYMQEMIRNAFSVEGKTVTPALAADLAYFGMVGFDGAFISLQSGDGRSMNRHMEQLTNALIALGEARTRTPEKQTVASGRKRAAKDTNPSA